MKDEIKKLLDKKKSIQEVADILDVDYNFIRNQMRKYGFKSKHIRSRKNAKHKCLECGEEDKSKFYGDRKTRCKGCHIKITHANQRNNKKFAVDHMGGSCMHCGYKKSINALQFHHVDSSKKDPDYNRMTSWGRDRIIKELKECIMLCANCHIEEHERIHNQKTNM